MKHSPLRFWLTFAVALGLGVLLHFLYGWFPNPVVALISPVRESLWEHVKILFIPLLLAGWFLGGRQGRAPWFCSTLIVCALMLAFSWAYHVTLEQDAMIFDLILYFVLMLTGFLLPRLLWPLAGWKPACRVCTALVVILAVLIVFFTYAPPDHLLFADLSGGVRTFLTIPV